MNWSDAVAWAVIGGGYLYIDDPKHFAVVVGVVISGLCLEKVKACEARINAAEYAARTAAEDARIDPEYRLPRYSSPG